MFGPARRVTAFGTVVYPDRTTLTGEPFTPGAPDFGVAVVELAERPRRAAHGELLRRPATASSAGSSSTATTGSLFLSSWQEFDATVELAPFGGHYEPVRWRTRSAGSTGAGRSTS